MHHDRYAAGNTLGFQREHLAYYREGYRSITDGEDNIEISETGQRYPAEGAYIASFVLEFKIVSQDDQANGHHYAGYYQKRLSTKSEGKGDD